MLKIVRLGLKFYSYFIDDRTEDKKVKDRKKNVGRTW